VIRARARRGGMWGVGLIEEAGGYLPGVRRTYSPLSLDRALSVWATG
jgi:hypothetical protein